MSSSALHTRNAVRLLVGKTTCCHAGPISKLLEHLRNKAPCASSDTQASADTSGNTLDALADGGAAGAAATARAVAQGAAAAAAATADAVGVPRRPRGTELDLKNRGLSELPAAVWETGALPAPSFDPPVPAIPGWLSFLVGENSTRRCLAAPCERSPVQDVSAGGALTALNVSQNQLRHIPQNLVALCANVTTITAARNALATWPLPLQHMALPHLKTLDLSFNTPLPVLPPHAFAACSGSLRELTLSGAVPLVPCQGVSTTVLASPAILSACHLRPPEQRSSDYLQSIQCRVSCRSPVNANPTHMVQRSIV